MADGVAVIKPKLARTPNTYHHHSSRKTLHGEGV